MRMDRRSWVICVFLAVQPSAGLAQSDEEKLVRESAKTLAKDRDPKDRAAAAKSLGGREQPEAVAALAKALSDPDASVRQAAASALWKTGKAAAAAKPELQKTLGDPEAAVVARAAGALSAMGVPDAELAEAWRRALQGARDDATAFLAARGLIGIDPPERLAPPILTYLSKNAEEAARPGRGRSGYDDSKSAEAAAKALEDLSKESAAPIMPLLDRTVRQSPQSGRYVFDALAKLKKLPPGTVDLALSHTSSPEATTRYAAISLAGKVKTEREAARWIPEAIRLLDDSDESVRMEACWVLKGVKGLAHEAALELTRLLAGDRSMSVRARAASALEEIGDASNPIPKAAKIAVAATSKSALVSAMKDKDHDLAPAAVAAYNVLYLDTAEVVAALADVAVAGADIAARQRALQCLRNRQGQAQSAVETIRPLARSSDKLIAQDAQTAIEWIERGGAGSPTPVKGSGSATSASSASSIAPPVRAAAERSAPASSVPSSSSASVPSSGSEERGLAVLRERKFEFNESGFDHALAEGDREAIGAYLDGGMSAKHVFVGENRRSPLMILFFSGAACQKPEEGRAIVALLLKHGADVNQVDQNKNTALMFAAGTCDRQTVRMLLKAGAKLDAKNGTGLTALEMGIVTGNSGVEELIAAGARLDPAKAKSWAEAYNANPKALALVKKASGQ
jgi:HEAT repeat protein